MKRILWFGLAGWLLGAICLPQAFAQAPDTPTTAGMTVHRDLAYAKIDGVDPKSLSLDLYAPATKPTRAPILVYVHGGGWTNGDKKGVGLKPQFFTGHGYLFASLNYRLMPAGKHPNNVRDVAAAIVWIHDHASEYGGDPGTIFITGHSAGAHLVALVATDPSHLKSCGQSLSLIKGVLPLDTLVYDLSKLPLEIETYARVFGTTPEARAAASPITYVAKGRGIPPFLISYSNGIRGEVEMRKTQAEAFQAALRGAGIRAELAPAADRNHGQINARFGDPNDNITQSAFKFFESLR